MNFGSKLNKVKLQADRIFQRTDKTDVTGELRDAEEQTEELRLLSEALSRSIEKRLNTYSVTEEKKHRKVPENHFADTLKDALREIAQNQNAEPVEKPLIRTTIEEIAATEQLLGKEVLDHEEQVEEDILAPLHKILKEDFPSLAKQKKALKLAGLDVATAKSKLRNSQNSMAQPNKLESCREELDEFESKLDQIRDAYACDLFTVLSKQREVARLSNLFLEAKLDYFQRSLDKLNRVLPPIRKMLENCPCSPVYGVPLHEHLRLTQQDIALPILVCVRRLIEVGLNEEGLLRMAGSSTKIKRLKGLFDAGLIDTETCSSIASDENRDYDVHVVAGAFKSYLRELPEPLLTHVKHDALIDAVRKADHEEKLRSLWQVINALPHQNYNNLKFVIKFLSLIASHSGENKMTPYNLAVVMAPNLIGTSTGLADEGDIVTLGRNMSLGGDYRLMVETLIEYADYFFKGEVNFGATPRIPEPPPSPRGAVNGFARSGSHRRTGSADFSVVVGGGLPPECESPKQPHRMKKKPAPMPPQGKPEDSPEQPTSAMSISMTGPLPAPRLHHSNSIKRPTAEPPKPPGGGGVPVKPPRPSPPQVAGDEARQPPRPSLSSTGESPEAKQSHIGFEKFDDLKVEVNESTPPLRPAPKSPRRSDLTASPAPIGFVLQSSPPPPSGEESTNPEAIEVRDKKSNNTVGDSEFRKSLEGVLKHQPQAHPRHLLKNTSCGDAPPLSSTGPAISQDTKSGFQLPDFPVAAQRTTTKDGSGERPEPIPRSDKPVVPDKPSVIKSIVNVEHSRPMVPEKPLLKGTLSSVVDSPAEDLDSSVVDSTSTTHKESTDPDSSKPNKPPKPNKPSLIGRITNEALAKTLESSDNCSSSGESDKKSDSTHL